MFKNKEVGKLTVTLPQTQQQQQQQIQQTASQRQPKVTPITDDYEISNTVLGLGINGKVVQCLNRQSGKTYALKVSIFYFIVLFVCSFLCDIIYQQLTSLQKTRYYTITVKHAEKLICIGEPVVAVTLLKLLLYMKIRTVAINVY